MRKVLTIITLVVFGIFTNCKKDESAPTKFVITHGKELTIDDVGPGAIGISNFTDVSGGYCTGSSPRVPNEWITKGVTRTITTGGETIDGYNFPEGTIVVEGANITSQVDIYGNQTSGDYGFGAVGIVFRGCRFRFGGYTNIYARSGHGMFVMVSYCDLGAPNQLLSDAQSDAFKGSGEAGKPYIIKRNYISLTANAGELGSHLIIEENLAENLWSFVGDHVDGWQFEGGNQDLKIIRNKIRLDAPYGNTGCISFFNAFAGDLGNNGYSDVLVDNNYLAGGSYSFYLSSNDYPVSNFKARGNQWSTEFGVNCGLYGPVYPTNPMNPNINGNEWSNNTWLDGDKAGMAIPIPGY